MVEPIDIVNWNHEDQYVELTEENDEDSGDDDVDAQTVVSVPQQNSRDHDEAINAFNVCLNWADKYEIDFHEIILLRKLRNKALDLKMKNIRQTQIDQFFQRKM